MSKHDLDVSQYSLAELFGVFGLQPAALDAAALKLAKHKVLMTHPDKSRLPAEYFLFYKRAYDIIAEFAAENIKQHTDVGTAAAAQRAARSDPQVDRAIRGAVANVDTDTFNRMFTSTAPVRTTRDNSWFVADSKPLTVSAAPGRIAEAMESLRPNRSDVAARESTTLTSLTSTTSLQGGDAMYGDEVEDSAEYIQSDVFSRLRFEDLRKVHRDQSIFEVSEKQFVPINNKSIVRESNIAPMSETEAMEILKADQTRWTAAYLQKEYDAKLRGSRAETASRAALAQFLQIKHVLK